ncbi:MAG: dimethylsulfonioproprionate lyase family protein [Pseudomonadota bacterium]
MSRDMFESALAEIRMVYEEHPALCEFLAFPSDVVWQAQEPHITPPALLMAQDESLETSLYKTLKDALISAGPHAKWRETYKGTNIGEDFLRRFGCYELFGLDGHFACQSTRGFLVYSPGGLYYPWHHHPAEEMYLIIAGEAEFATEGNAPKLLKPGDTVFHKENQPHNMLTLEKGVLAWVQWRGELTVPPVLTDRLNEVGQA